MHIGLLYAMPEERQAFTAQLSTYQTRQIAGLNAYVTRIGAHDITLVECGIGKVNAAIAATKLIQDKPLDLLISTGVSGGIRVGKPITLILPDGEEVTVPMTYDEDDPQYTIATIRLEIPELDFEEGTTLDFVFNKPYESELVPPEEFCRFWSEALLPSGTSVGDPVYTLNLDRFSEYGVYADCWPTFTKIAADSEKFNNDGYLKPENEWS